MPVVEVIDKERETMAGMSKCPIETAVEEYGLYASIIDRVIAIFDEMRPLFVENWRQIFSMWFVRVWKSLFIEKFGCLFMENRRQIIIIIRHRRMVDTSCHSADIRFFIIGCDRMRYTLDKQSIAYL